MKRLMYIEDQDDDYNDADVQRIIEVCNTNGYVISPISARKAWEAYSTDVCAGWITLGDDEAIMGVILSRCTVFDE